MASNHMNEQEREQAKFSLSGATLYGINAVIGSGIFLLPRAIYKGLGPASIAVMFGTAILTIMLAVCFAEVSGYFGKNGGASNIPNELLVILLALTLASLVGPLPSSLGQPWQLGLPECLSLLSLPLKVGTFHLVLG